MRNQKAVLFMGTTK